MNAPGEKSRAPDTEGPTVPRRPSLSWRGTAHFGLLLFGSNALLLASGPVLEWLTPLQRIGSWHLWAGLAHAAAVLPIAGLILINLGLGPILRQRGMTDRLAVTCAIVTLVAGACWWGPALVSQDQSETRRLALASLHFFGAIGLAGRLIFQPPIDVAPAERRTSAALLGAMVTAGLAVSMHVPRKSADPPPPHFAPSPMRTATGQPIAAERLMAEAYCRSCHADVHEGWQYSAHHFSSFTNPAYAATIRETRRSLRARHGHAHAARLCAGCHDPVLLLEGSFDDLRFDAPDYDATRDPRDGAGITCLVCHAVTRVNDPTGNGTLTIASPTHYPWASSSQAVLRRISDTLLFAAPGAHKAERLRPLHATAQFCGTCHKVRLPPELNDYRRVPGQNHYDSHRLSGVAGHAVDSFHYPSRAEANCNGCHMPVLESHDPAARHLHGNTNASIHDHLFPGANTALPHLLKMPDWVQRRHVTMLQRSVRIDLFGVRDGETVYSPLRAPVRPIVPALRPGSTLLLEVVVRNLGVGHTFTEGTSDANQVWIDLAVRDGERTVGRSGGLGPGGRVDPWSHFLNRFTLDGSGRRIDRRNAQDIRVALYDHQIGPGRSAVVHYRFRVPDDAPDAITVTARVRYRKFDVNYMQFVRGSAHQDNDLPITTLAEDRVTFPVHGPDGSGVVAPVPAWQRWNDYGIGLLHAGSGRLLKQAEHAFQQVEKLGRAEGPVNLARMGLRDGRLDAAATALRRARTMKPPGAEWSLRWFGAMIDWHAGRLDHAVEGFDQLRGLDTPETRRRGFDFSQDDRLLIALGSARFERGRATGEEAEDLAAAEQLFRQVLQRDPENVHAHHLLSQWHRHQGNDTRARHHQILHDRFRPDENARDRAVRAARRRYPAADHASRDVVIHDLHRPGAYGMAPPSGSTFVP